MQLLSYLNSDFAALESSTIGHRSRLSDTVPEAVSPTSGKLRILVRTVEGFPGAPSFIIEGRFSVLGAL